MPCWQAIVKHISPTIAVGQPSRSPTEKAPESRSEPELAAPRSPPGSVSMAVLCYHHVQAFGRPGPITGSPRGRRQARPRRSDVVFTPVTTHSCGREKVTVSRWCGHERLNCGLQKPCDTSYYMLSEPCLVVRPFSRTAVRHVPPSTVSVAYRESTREPLRARRSAAEVDPGVCKPGHAPYTSCASLWVAWAGHRTV